MVVWGVWAVPGPETGGSTRQSLTGSQAKGGPKGGPEGLMGVPERFAVRTKKTAEKEKKKIEKI